MISVSSQRRSPSCLRNFPCSVVLVESVPDELLNKGLSGYFEFSGHLGQFFDHLLVQINSHALAWRHHLPLVRKIRRHVFPVFCQTSNRFSGYSSFGFRGFLHKALVPLSSPSTKSPDDNTLLGRLPMVAIVLHEAAAVQEAHDPRLIIWNVILLSVLWLPVINRR